MNNKKLFKGALVLFASILMAVSCSSNSKPDGGTDKGDTPDKPGADKTLKVELAKESAALAEANKTTAKLVYDNTHKFGSSATHKVTDVSIKLQGDDATALKATEVSIAAIVGQDDQWNNSGIGDTKKSLAPANEELAKLLTTAFGVAVDKGVVTLTAKDALITTQVQSAMNAANDAGMLKLTLKFKVEGKDEKTLDIYVGLVRKDN